MPASVLEHASQELARQFGVVSTGISLEGYCVGCQEDRIRRGHALANPGRPVELRRE